MGEKKKSSSRSVVVGVMCLLMEHWIQCPCSGAANVQFNVSFCGNRCGSRKREEILKVSDKNLP